PRRARAAAALLQDHPLPADRRAGPGGARRAAQGHRAGGAADRMKLRHGLYPRFLLLAASVLVVMLGVVGVMLHRQATMQREVVALSQESIHTLVSSRVRERGEAVAAQLADSLVNPLYYFDLDAIVGILTRIVTEPDVRYAIVYDNSGAVIHDGSRDIATYGQAMQDPLAYEVITARGPHVQMTDKILDVSAPVRIGDQRIGGVRVGYSLGSVAADEARATSAMRARMDQISRHHALWVLLMLLVMVAIGVLVGLVVQRALVRPIRQLANAAREIEAGNFAADVPLSPRNDEVGDLMRAFSRIGDSIVRHDRDIRRMAYTDALTGLSNRLACREHLDQQLMQVRGAARQMALLFADIDDFKRVND